MEDRVSALETELAGLNLKLLQIAWKMDDIDKRIPEEPSETSEEPSEISDVEVYDIRGKLIVVENELSEIRTRIGVMNKLISTYENPDIDLPDTNIVSHSLWKRMWAVFGHGLVGNVILTTWIIAIIIMIFRET